VIALDLKLLISATSFEGDPSPDGQGTIVIKRGNRSGSHFPMGQQYAEAFKSHGLFR